MNDDSTKKQDKTNNNRPQQTNNNLPQTRANLQETPGTRGRAPLLICIFRAQGDCSDCGDTTLSLTNSKLSLSVCFFPKVFITFFKDKIKSRSNWKKKKKDKETTKYTVYLITMLMIYSMTTIPLFMIE